MRWEGVYLDFASRSCDLPFGRRCSWTDKKDQQYIGEWLGGLKHGQGAMQYGNGDVYVGRYENGCQILGSLQVQQGTYSGRFEGKAKEEKAHSTVPRIGEKGSREKLDERVKDSQNHSSFTWNDETHYEVCLRNSRISAPVHTTVITDQIQ